MHKKNVFFVIPSRPVALGLFVLAFSGGLALLSPFSGVIGFLKNLLISVVGLLLLVFFGALIGAVLRDFLLEMN